MRADGPGTAAAARGLRPIRTPEGVRVEFELAPAGARLGAFLVDFLLLALATIAISVAGIVTLFSKQAGGLALAMVVNFLLFNFYFAIAELAWGGQTIAKRLLGLRVVMRDGGPLNARAVIARNLTRDLEFFLPLQVLLMGPQTLIPSAPAWGALIGVLWLLIFALLPLFNRDRLRVGDLIAGTMVVAAPKAQLLGDLADEEIERFDRVIPLSTRYPFTRDQLDRYGIHELQTLEAVLRTPDRYRHQDLLVKIRDNIQRKIDWPEEDREPDPEPFLLAFYKAQRARLEREMLFGRRRESKHDAPLKGESRRSSGSGTGPAGDGVD